MPRHDSSGSSSLTSAVQYAPVVVSTRPRDGRADAAGAAGDNGDPRHGHRPLSLVGPSSTVVTSKLSKAPRAPWPKSRSCREMETLSSGDSWWWNGKASTTATRPGAMVTELI